MVMKKMTVVVMLLLALPLYAENKKVEIYGQEAEELYRALTIGEDRSIAMDYQLFVKKLSGLICERRLRYWPAELFSCVLEENLTQKQLEGIYYALRSDLEELEHRFELSGANIYIKKLRALWLRKKSVIPEIVYQLIIVDHRSPLMVEGESAQKIYAALGVKSEGPVENRFKKEVGPLICIKSEVFLVGNFCRCQLLGQIWSDRPKSVGVRGEDARVIYEALRVKEEPLKDSVSLFAKRAGTLECSKAHFLGEEHYSCILEEG